jgi:hypothetical protein
MYRVHREHENHADLNRHDIILVPMIRYIAMSMYQLLYNHILFSSSPPIDRQSEIAYYRYKPDRTTIKAASTSEYGSGDPSPTTSHQNPHHHVQQQVQPLTSQQHRHHHSHGRSRDSSTRNNDYNAQLSIGYHGKRPPPKSASDSEAFKVPTVDYLIISLIIIDNNLRVLFVLQKKPNHRDNIVMHIMIVLWNNRYVRLIV